MKSNKCSSASLQGNQRRRQRRRGRLACEERADSSQEQAVEAGGRRLQGHGGCSGPHVQVAQPRPHPSSSQDLSVK